MDEVAYFLSQEAKSPIYPRQIGKFNGKALMVVELSLRIYVVLGNLFYLHQFLRVKT